MSAPTDTVPTATVDESKAPAPEPVVEVKTEAPPAESTSEPTPAAEATSAEPTGETPATTEETPAESTKKPKSPSFLSKLLAPLKGKGPKSPKKEKTESEATPAAEPVGETAEPAPNTEDPPADTKPVEPASEAAIQETPAPAEVTETTAPESSAVEEKPAEKRTARPLSKEKVGRRLSARVNDLFKPKPKKAATPPAKPEDTPPQIEQPATVAPLEAQVETNDTPAPAAAAAEEPAPLTDAPPAAPVVAATA